MFKEKTVFIVGAGAGAEIGLPTGEELLGAVGKTMRFTADHGGLGENSGQVELSRAVGRHLGGDHRLEDFQAMGRKIANTISTFPSIDEALHYWSENPEAVQLGKLAIVRNILKAESGSTLRPLDDGRVHVDRVNDTWLPSFFGMAVSGMKQQDVINAFYKVTVINFNYDRSLEHYLYWALQQRGGIDGDDASETMQGLKVIRPYGWLAPLDWMHDKGIPFGQDPLGCDLYPLSQNIRTFTEQREETETAEDIDKALRDARLVVFLGFGYHAQNMTLLKPANGSSRQETQAVMATVMGISLHNHHALSLKINNELGFVNDPQLLNLTCSALLSELRLSIQMTVG